MPAPAPSGAALGLKVKSGWAAAVLVSGPAAAPRVLDARRIELADGDSPATYQPYHAGTGTAQTDTREIARLIRLVERRAGRSITELLEQYRAGGWQPFAAAVVGTSETDPATITNPHIRIHAQEGQLFRRVVSDALAAAGVACRPILERDMVEDGPKRLGLAGPVVRRRLTALRPATPGPWRAEQKMAALAGWLLLRAGP